MSNARLKNINDIQNLVEGMNMMQHTFENFNDGLTMLLIENRLKLNEGWLGDAWDGISGAFHTTMDVIQGAAAAVSLASYSSVVGAPIGLIASVVDAAIDVGYAAGNLIESGIAYASGDSEAGWENLKQAGSRAAWAGVGLIPIAGDVATLGRVGKGVAKTIDTANDLSKVADALDTGKDLSKLIKAGDISADAIKTVAGMDDIADATKALSSLKGDDLIKTIDKIKGFNIKQLDNVKDISKIAGQGSDAFSDVMKTSKSIESAADVTMSGNKLTKWSANAIDRMGNSKFLSKMTFGGTAKFAGYADNFKLANASFATVTDGGKLATNAMGNFKHFDVGKSSDLAKKMFGGGEIGVWGGGGLSSKVLKSIDPDAYKDLTKIYKPDLLKGKFLSMSNLNPGNYIRYTRSMFFPAGDLTMNLGKSSNLFQATSDITKRAKNIDFAKEIKFAADLKTPTKFTSRLNTLKKTLTPNFTKMATNKWLNRINKAQKWNKTPQFTELWDGRIKTYDERKQETGGQRRQFLNLGPEYQSLNVPFTKDKKVNLSKLSNPMSILNLNQTPEIWKPGQTIDIDAMNKDIEQQKKSADEFMKVLDTKQQDTIQSDSLKQQIDMAKEIERMKNQLNQQQLNK